MEIKELVDKTFKLKILRNHLENMVNDLNDQITRERDDKDRCGLPFDAELDQVSDGTRAIGYGLKQINEGISYFEAAHRQSIRFKEVKQSEDKPEEDQTKEDKGDK
jgi:hypothetical protein